MTVKFIPYLVMNGNSKEAIQFYQKVFKVESVEIVTFGDMPANEDFPLPEEAKGLVAHATIRIGESDLMFSDSFPDQPHQQGNQVTICVTTNNIEEARQIFDALQEKGQVNMPLHKTDFSPAYGIITDRFGVTFQIYTENH